MLRRLFFIATLLGVALWGLSTAQAGPPGRIVGLLDVAHPVNWHAPKAHQLQLWLLGVPEHARGTTWFDLVHHQRAALTNMAFSASASSGRGPTIRRGGSLEVRFDGVNDYATLGTGTHDYPNATFSVACWFRATTAGYLVAKRVGTNNGTNGGWFLRLDAGGTLTARIIDVGNLSAGGRTTTTTALLDGAWHHVLVVLTTNTATLSLNDVAIYIDGLLNQGARTDSGSQPYSVSVDPLTIGSLSDQQAGSFLTGALDDLRIYRGGFTAQTAWQLFQHSDRGAPGLLQMMPLTVGRVATASSPIRHRSHLQ